MRLARSPARSPIPANPESLKNSLAAQQSQRWCSAAPGRCIPNILGASIYPSVNSALADARRETADELDRAQGAGTSRQPCFRRSAASDCSIGNVDIVRGSFELCLTNGLQPQAPKACRRSPPQRRQAPQLAAASKPGGSHQAEASRKRAKKRRKPRARSRCRARSQPAAPRTRMQCAERDRPTARAGDIVPRDGAARESRGHVDRSRKAVDGRKALGQAASRRTAALLRVGRRQHHRQPRQEQNPMLGGSPPYDEQTAVYDITRTSCIFPTARSSRRIPGSAPRWTTRALRMSGCRA